LRFSPGNGVLNEFFNLFEAFTGPSEMRRLALSVFAVSILASRAHENSRIDACEICLEDVPAFDDLIPFIKPFRLFLLEF